MGEQADLIINGDVCEGCGENFDDEGQGFPRRCSSCGGGSRKWEGGINPIKSERLQEARRLLKSAGLTWKEFNKGFHFKVNEIDFWPSTTKWMCPATGEVAYGIKELIAYLKPKKINIKKLSPEQMFEIAKKVKPMNLMDVMKELHKEIYK